MRSNVQASKEDDPLIARSLSQDFDAGLTFSPRREDENMSMEENWKGETASHPDLTSGRGTSGIFSRFRSYNINSARYQSSKNSINYTPAMTPVFRNVNECVKLVLDEPSEFRTSSV